MMTKPKKFDCVRMKHEGARRIQQELAGMTLEQQLAYWDREYQELLKEQEELRRRRAEAPPSNA